MSARRLMEEDINLIEAEIKSKIGAALVDIRADRNDSAVTTEKPQTYLRFPRALGLKTPAIFTIGRRMAFKQAERGQNHINATATIEVSCLVEDRNADKLVTKAYRYMNALHQVLDQTELVSSDNKVKIVIKVTDVENSELFTNTDKATNPESVFRKEVYLTLEVEHFENW